MGKGMSGHQLPKSRTDEWLTPREILLPLKKFDLDPCAPIDRPWPIAEHHYTKIDDGLNQKWFGRIWLNPPYSNITPWLELMSGICYGMLMLFNKTDRIDFHDLIYPFADSKFYFKGRIPFCNSAGIRAKDDAGAPSVLFAYSEYDSQVLSAAGFKGTHLPIRFTPMIVVGISPTWISVVSIAVRNLGDEDLKPVYEMVERIAPDKVAKNQHWKAKIRQTIYVMRNRKKDGATNGY